MHILIITNRLVVGEGQGRVNVELARAAAQRGHVVTCLAHQVDNRLLMEPTVEWVHMPDANAPIALIGNQRFARASTSWIRRFGKDADLVIGNSFNTWATTDISIVHFVHSAWRQSDVHDARIRRDAYGAYQWVYSALNARFEQRALGRARHIVAVSNKVRDELRELGISETPISVIHNGVDIDEFAPGTGTHAERESLGLPATGPLAFFAGDIRTPRKGLDTTLHAMQSVPDLHLAIAGATDGSPYPELAASLGIDDRTHFLGFRRDIPALMAASDFFVFPSRYEACSLVLLEAMGAGLPIITAQTAGGAELVSADAGVVLDDPDDTAALSAALRRFVDETSASSAMSRASRGIAEQHTWDHMAAQYLQLFESLHDASPARRSAFTVA